MRHSDLPSLYSLLSGKKSSFPLDGQIELTYRCNLDCIHCYCKGSENKANELGTADWKRILDQIHKEGCVYLTISGGDPLVRDDFLELYRYARAKGFIITVFTNAQALDKKTIGYLIKSPPYALEITLNGITPVTYERISGVKGSFVKAIAAIKAAKDAGLPVVIKSNCLKQNKHEVTEVKKFADKLLGTGKGKHFFKYDPLIYPRLNSDKTPCQFRLSYKEILKLKEQDPDIWKEHQKCLNAKPSGPRGTASALYWCSSWMQKFFIDPYGWLKFCGFSRNFGVDLKSRAFGEGFYSMITKLRQAKFTTDSKCRCCSLRPVCYSCPAKAFLETGNQEAPVDYFCRLAREMSDEKSELSKV